MPSRTPQQIQEFLDANAHKMDLSVQYLGDEPNSYRKPWATSAVRWLLCASWPYEAAAGNQSMPTVYKFINDGLPERLAGAAARDDFLCDRFYLPATPRDLKLFEKNGYPVFGIESKHQLADFDVVGTSISYPVLAMSFHKMLNMSGVPARRAHREPEAHRYPFVLLGGQAYGAPEVLSPIADCIWLGEVEDEPGNPGIAVVTSRIAQMKAEGRWGASTEGRVGCYEDLAREFNFLYFPRFVDVSYRYERRAGVRPPSDARDGSAWPWQGELTGGAAPGTAPSRQVASYTANLAGMRLPLLKRIVKDLDAVPGLDNPPVLYADPQLCLGGETQFPTPGGLRSLSSLAGTEQKVWAQRPDGGGPGWVDATIDQHGRDVLDTITFVAVYLVGYSAAPSHTSSDNPDDQSLESMASMAVGKPVWRDGETVGHRATPAHRWPLADLEQAEDGTVAPQGAMVGETSELAVGDAVAALDTPEDTPGSSRGAHHWRVLRITKGTAQEPVFCATVPGVGFWTLSSGVYTGNSANMEAARGCTAWCTFCALTYRQKPFRQRSVPYMVNFGKEFMRNTGNAALVPFGPDLAAHTARNGLIRGLIENVSDEVDAGAMRVDDFIADPDFILIQVHGGLDSVTLGVEGNSQRMRDLLGKGVSDADVVEAVTRGIRAGIRKFKLFMISNLPGEDEGDVYRILKLARDLADVRESLGQPNVRIQFSWSPLLIEANTPLQWFATSTASRVLADAWEELRDLKVDAKLGGKSQLDKSTFFQLCQRASREVGEALVDVMDQHGVACWGGVPRTVYAALVQALRDRGFHNALEDCFDERDREDLFGWEFVDQGISHELMWSMYQQMREFLEQTDSRTYDESYAQLGSAKYSGSEWVPKCDQQCQGRSCGVCDGDDLRIRQRYLREGAADGPIDLTQVRAVDQRSVATRVRVRLWRPERYRYVMNDHLRFAVRRAAYRAAHALGVDYSISKRSLRFVSDAVRYRDWTCGTDYLEFGLTQRCSREQVEAFLAAMQVELTTPAGTPWLTLGYWQTHPVSAPNMRTDVDQSLWELELDADPDTAAAWVRRWHEAPYVKMVLRSEGEYFQQGNEEVNAKDYVTDLWLRRGLTAGGVGAEHALVLRILARGRPSPYEVWAALTGKASWSDAAARPAYRVDAFLEIPQDQDDIFRPSCVSCGRRIPVNVLDQPYDLDECPRCGDEDAGRMVPGQGAPAGTVYVTDGALWT